MWNCVGQKVVSIESERGECLGRGIYHAFTTRVRSRDARSPRRFSWFERRQKSKSFNKDFYHLSSAAGVFACIGSQVQDSEYQGCREKLLLCFRSFKEAV